MALDVPLAYHYKNWLQTSAQTRETAFESAGKHKHYMATGSRVPIAERDESGGLIKLATVSITADYLTLTIKEADDTQHQYQIPENSGLAFGVVIENLEGGRQRILLEESESLSNEAVSFELKQARFSPKLLLETFTNGQGVEGLALKFVGENEEDILKSLGQFTMPLTSLAGIAFQRTADSLLIKTFLPPKTQNPV